MSRLAFNLVICASAILVCCIQFAVAGTNETDRLALLQIKDKIEDPLGLLNSWNESIPLTGTISPFIGNLSFLSLLSLQNNSFEGIIPPEITRLFRLEVLSLSHNSFVGEIPSNISRCSNLALLDVYKNKLFGGIPPELGSLPYLQNLVLSENEFTGIIPASLGNLTYLSILHLQQTNVGGNIPSSLGMLKNLGVLKLDDNNLFGVVPPSIFNLSALQTLNLGSNSLEGSLPSDLGNMLPYLQYFAIDYNNSSGSIPASIANLTNLVHLIIAHNKFGGQVPSLKGLQNLESLVIFDNNFGIGDPATDWDFVSSLANSTMLTNFEAANSHFSGTFPRTFCNFSELQDINIGQNNLTGEIPDCIGNLAKLIKIDVRQNKLVGAVPQSIGRLQNIFTLYLGDNQLSGHIPSSIGNLTRLTQFMLYENNFQGNIPSALGKCENLLALDLSSNNLSGGIPSEVLRLPRLSLTLDLSNNRLTGPLSDEVGGLVNLQVLYVSDNLLSGEMPTTLDACLGLVGLHMQGNLFQGAIPQTLSPLGSLQILDLSRNNLSGKIPEYLQDLQLQMLNLSYNNLVGEVPTLGVFSNATSFSVFDNGRLCGGLPELKLHSCSLIREVFGHKNHILMEVLFGISGITLLVALVALYIVFRTKRTKNPTDLSDPKKAMPNLSYQMLYQATNGFSSENLIGSGASGVVYKGILEDVGTVLAIKIFNLQHRSASKSFFTECKALRNIRHRNLIKVITACSSLDCKGNDFKALVYEYMPNGSLDDWLHPNDEFRGVEISENAPGNLFCQRLEIVVDVGFALEYLHHSCGSSVIHCDLKPSNVLLDEDLIAHVGDFGLAKIISQGSNSFSSQSSSIEVKGTIGYAPPEYGMGNEVWMPGDVYSFGILVLEMFTGKRPTDEIFREGSSLRDFVKAALFRQDIRIIDQALHEEMAIEDYNSRIILEVLVSVLETALTCSSELPRERPDMTDVVAKLSSVQTKLKGLPMRR